MPLYCETTLLSMLIGIVLSVSFWYNFGKNCPTVVQFLQNSSPKTVVFSSIMMLQNLKGITPAKQFSTVTANNSGIQEIVAWCCQLKLILELRHPVVSLPVELFISCVQDQQVINIHILSSWLPTR